MLIRSLHSFVIFVVGCVFLVGVAGCQGNDQEGDGVANQPNAVASSVATEEPMQEAATETAVPTDLPPATATNIPTAVPTESDTATPLPSPSPTATTAPTETSIPTPMPTATPIPVPEPEWLSYLNRFREMANLPLLKDQEAYTVGSQLHSRYMVGNDEPIAHREEEEKPYYDEAGDQAARNGNLFATSQLEANYMWSINFWISAPFHLLGILDPRLEVVGYGTYEEEVGDTHVASVLDIKSHPRGTGEGVEYPIMFPGDGSETWVVRHSLYEWPYPFDGCAGYGPPTGPPIVLLLGDGSGTPNVTSHRFAKGDQALESCLFDETSYRNNDSYAEGVGRTILKTRDAVVIMPRKPLGIDETYTVQVTADGETYTWSFSTRRGPD